MGKKGKQGGAGNSGAPLLLLGIVLWTVAWFVSVYKGQELLGGFGAFARQLGSSPQAAMQGLDGPDWLPGWPACKFAWNLLVSDHVAGGLDQWKQRVLGASCLTNAAMLLAIWSALTRRHSRAIGVLLLVCVGIDSSWIWLSDQNPFDWLRAGYFLWLVSFLLAGIGLLGARRT